MYQVDTISYVFDVLRVVAVGGIFKLFVWDMFIKDYWDAGRQNLKETADCCREAKANELLENRAGELPSNRCGVLKDTDV